MHRIYKKTFLFLLLITQSCFCFSQEKADTTLPKFRIGFTVFYAYSKGNMNAVRSYPYSLNLPSNNFQGFGVGFSFLNSHKISIPVFLIYEGFGNQKKGMYNNYNLNGFSSRFEGGVSISYNAYKKNNATLKGIFPAVGVSYGGVATTYSTKQARLNNTDTTLLFDQSNASALLIHTEVAFNFFNLALKSQRSFGSIALTLKIGYDFQPLDPKWHYNSPFSMVRDPSVDKKVNLGGIYFTLGFSEQFWKKNKPA